MVLTVIKPLEKVIKLSTIKQRNLFVALYKKKSS